MDQQTTLLIVGSAILVMALAIVAFVVGRRRRTKVLVERFGPEYSRAVEELGRRSKAETELQERARRVEAYDIRPLTGPERSRYGDLWQSAQARFVDSPLAAVAEADALVTDVMRLRGYPVHDFESRTADLSVDHPKVCEHYRAAHDLALKSSRGEADTEHMRQAMVHYRALFEDLLEAPEAELVGAR
jgi:hypothetical protein